LSDQAQKLGVAKKKKGRASEEKENKRREEGRREKGKRDNLTNLNLFRPNKLKYELKGLKPGV
jgi:hypothetical protein